MTRIHKRYILEKTGVFVKWDSETWEMLLRKRPETYRVRFNSFKQLSEGCVYPIVRSTRRTYYIFDVGALNAVFINFDEIKPLTAPKEEEQFCEWYDDFKEKGLWYANE